jgi:branched-chain amino acid transport system substrate-binding protein
MTFSMGRPGRLTVWLAVVGVAAAVAGCGSSSKESSGSQAATATAPTATGTTAATPTGAPIKIGSVCSCTGVQASVAAAAGDAITAWGQHVNASGGINGHPVKLVLEDDGGDPAKSQQAAKRLVEQDKVVAIVSDYSFQDQGWADYVTKKGVPVVGGLMVEIPFLTNPNFFGTGAQPPSDNLAFARVLDQLGKKSFRVLYCSESPICALAVKLAQGAAGAAGTPLTVSGGKVSSSAPDYTAACLNAKNAGVDSVLLGVNALVMPRIMSSCLRQGYKPTLFAVAEATGPSLLKNSAFDGAVFAGPTAFYSDDSIPGVKEFTSAIEAYKPGFLDSSTMSNNALQAWTAGKLFEAAAKSAGLGPNSTSADVKRGLYKLKDETLGGLVAPITYTKGQPFVTPCAFVHRIQGGKFVLEGGKPSCAPPAQFGKLVASLKALHG